jgi:hypothetical protein
MLQSPPPTRKKNSGTHICRCISRLLRVGVKSVSADAVRDVTLMCTYVCLLYVRDQQGGLMNEIISVMSIVDFVSSIRSCAVETNDGKRGGAI